MKSTLNTKIASTSTATLFGTSASLQEAVWSTPEGRWNAFIGDAEVDILDVNKEDTATLIQVDEARQAKWGKGSWGETIVERFTCWMPHKAFSSIETYEVMDADGTVWYLHVATLNAWGRQEFAAKLTKATDFLNKGLAAEGKPAVQDNITLLKEAAERRYSELSAK